MNELPTNDVLGILILSTKEKLATITSNRCGFILILCVTLRNPGIYFFYVDMNQNQKVTAADKVKDLKDPKALSDKDKSKYRYSSEIQQMMFVFGEVSEPCPETIMLVEDIVRSQVIEIIIQAAAQAAKRGSRYMSAEDLIFLIRHDRAKVNRLRTYLSWKDVRKNAKDTNGNDATEEIMEEPNAGTHQIL
ncbi:7619_t:CDS:2 [Acaulospora morrowiae]|uniref:7619_t:CDS:1 n=1 Tax=Acaulospora morrowiae TaxID=94023 RepID=A0A9N9GES7_9GLOM|nr:7619_t:CDS:2 [Acaulospora morrowiae]